MSGVRTSVVALLQGVLVLCGVMLLVTWLMIGVVFSAVVGERRFELGVLMAVGLPSPVGLLAAEAGLATGLGGLLGLLGAWGWLRLASHTLLVSLDFAWPTAGELAGLGVFSMGLSVLVGVLGALQPAWQLGRRDPYELLRGEA
jgi:putative ABC transport system permease protein